MTYGLIIIGGGPAGLSGGMYAARLNLKTLVLAVLPGGLLTNIHDIENWPGEKSISGMDLANNLMEHAKTSGAEIKFEEVTAVEKGKNEAGEAVFKVKTTGGAVYESYSLLFATGGKHRLLNVAGEKEFSGKGVSYCALCDANFYKDKTVLVVGGGDAAAKDAMVLAEKCSKVYMLVRSVLRAEAANIKLLEQNPKIEIIYGTEVAEIMGTGVPSAAGAKVALVRLKSGRELTVDGVFVAIGLDPMNVLAKDLGVKLNDKGEIIVDRASQTNLAGVYAAGDCTDIEIKQAIVGSSQAVMAAFSAYKYIRNLIKIYEK
ncbi:FAD-dependent oxidoreductase [Candidatus Peregrinibacteria bacterium]|nr:FAD-dependent oxidoreductase [Candidatus Peregrinibacteria bacterium]